MFNRSVYLVCDKKNLEYLRFEVNLVVFKNLCKIYVVDFIVKESEKSWFSYECV